jgi:hypothetical protein
MLRRFANVIASASLTSGFSHSLTMVEESLSQADSEMDEITKLEDRYLELESRSGHDQVKREVVRLKIARNALVRPLSRLPDELFVLIVKQALVQTYRYYSHDERHYVLLRRFTAVYGRMRAILIATPSLWTYVNMRWRPPIIDTFVKRAGPLFLNVNFGQERLNKPQLKRIRAIFPRVCSLRYWALSKQDCAHFWKSMKGVESSALRMLHVIASHNISGDHLPTWSLASIISLNVNATVQSFPYTTSLVRLKLEQINISLPKLHLFLQQNPLLRCLEFHTWVIPREDYQKDTTALRPVQLPELQSLCIIEEIESMLLLLQILPTPSLHLYLHMEECRVQMYSEPPHLPPWTGPYSTITCRLEAFWTLATGDLGTFPLGRISLGTLYNGPYLLLQHGDYERRSDYAPVLDYHGLWYMMEAIPFLHRVHELAINIARGGLSLIGSSFSFACVPDLQKLVIIDADNDGPYDLETTQQLLALKDWITKRHKSGRPLKTVMFRSCPNPQFVQFRDHVAENSLAERILWED